MMVQTDLGADIEILCMKLKRIWIDRKNMYWFWKKLDDGFDNFRNVSQCTELCT